ncbi:hypothetical protein DH2020_039176 [Rehmannia glutinosa]|uniref:Uncharacterized protein n=1 Tax=Rehmannia glutinosa TaxID=99300 RepID=A0ABR0UY73_REHGL
MSHSDTILCTRARNQTSTKSRTSSTPTPPPSSPPALRPPTRLHPRFLQSLTSSPLHSSPPISLHPPYPNLHLFTQLPPPPPFPNPLFPLHVDPPAAAVLRVWVRAGTKHLTEPVWDTIQRDLSRIVSNLKLVVFPNPFREDPGKALRDWDLWGPFFFIVFLGLVLSWSASVEKGVMCFLANDLVSCFELFSSLKFSPLPLHYLQQELWPNYLLPKPESSRLLSIPSGRWCLYLHVKCVVAADLWCFDFSKERAEVDLRRVGGGIGDGLETDWDVWTWRGGGCS